MKMQKGEPVKFEVSLRYVDFNRHYAIRDIYDALVELITNSDDSYHCLYKQQLRNEDGGPILIEIKEQRKGEKSLLIVRDRAEGMTSETMRDRLCNIGQRMRQKGDRGFMGRGAKDCTVLGNMVVESIKDDRYYKCELTNILEFIPYKGRVSASKDIRKDLHIEHGNGTVVGLEIAPERKIPHIETIMRDLPWHYALRDILSEKGSTKLMIRNLNNPKMKPEKVVYRQPEGELVCNENFLIAGYPEAKAKLKIWKVLEPFEDPTDLRFRRFGLLIKGERAIYECSLLYSGLDKDPYARRYFGRIECDYIDQLLDDFDKRCDKREPHPPENPSILIDPNRQEGLRRDHPFTKALFQVPSEKLKELIEKDKEKDKTTAKEIASKETRERLNKLAIAASKFLNQQIEDLEEITTEESIDEDSFTKRGVLIYPTYLNVAVGQIRSLTFYVNRSICDKEGHNVAVTSDDPSISILDSSFQLREHQRRNDLLIGTFRVQGEQVKDAVCIQTKSVGIPIAEALVNVVEDKIEEHEFTHPLEFEHNNYRVREGATKTLRLYAKYPELVSQDNTRIEVLTSDSESVPVRGQCYLTPVVGSNYAIGEVKVQGRRLKSRSVEITASINGNKAITRLKVDLKEKKGPNVKFEIVPQDLGMFRAMWAVAEGKPNLLKISARHDSIKRYLGPEPDYPGQHTPLFRILLAEIVTESVCRKVLELEAKARHWEFNELTSGSRPDIIINSVLSLLQKRVKDFAAIAHNVMLSSVELGKIF